MTHRALVSILALASASTLVACAASAPIDGAGGGEASASDDLSPTTSKAELLANDTSASSLFTDRYTPAARFHGSTSPVSNGDALPGSTDAKSLLVGSVSKVSVHTLVGSLPVYAEAQSWFCYGGKNPLSSSADGDQCGSHIDIGVDANSTAHVKKEVADMRSRGLDGVIVDWDGQAAGLGVIDQKATGPALNTGAIRLFKEQAEASNGAFHFAVCEDEGIKDCAAKSGCDVTQALVSDLAFLATNFFDSPAYVHQGGRPVLFFFSEDTWVAKYGKSIDWSYVRAHAPKNPLFVFENAGGFGHAESDGAYAWLHTQAIGSYPGSDPFGTEGFLPYFYQQVASHPTKIAWASAYKGFDDGVVNGWGGGRRYTGQQCGKTFLDTMAAAKAHASAVDGLQIPTWDDYEEGSEVETGIDNHLAIHASLTGTKLSWSLAPESGAPADCTEAIAQGFDLGATVHHYAVYASSDGQGLALVADQIPASARSI
ncbi:MAG TPA: hypothetical protein VHB21_09870, partial [Minicystis sp.]|nr:hypothetical protein [Minicystis sp.]